MLGTIVRAASIAACGIGVAGAAAEPPPISAFVGAAKLSMVQISPAGDYLSLTMRTEDADGAGNGESAINGGATSGDTTNGDAEDGQSTESTTFRVLTYPGKEIRVNRNFGARRSIADTVWVDDHHLLVAPAAKGRYAEGLGRTGELMSVAVQTGVVKRLGWGFLLDSLPEDAKRILFVNARDRHLEAHRVRLGTSRPQRVARGAAPYGSFVPDGAGGVAFSTGSTEDDKTQVYYREGRQAWQLVEQYAYGATGWTPLWRTASPGKYYTLDNRGSKNEGLDNDADATDCSYVHCRHNAKSTTALGIYDAANDAHEPVVVRHPHVDVTDVLFDFGRRNVWGVRFDHHYPEIVYTAPQHPLARTHAMLQELYPQDVISFTSSSRDHSLSVAEIRSDHKPGDFVLVDLKTRRIEPLGSRRPALSPDELSPVTPVEFKVRDGATVYGYVTSHPSAKKPGPTVVLVHGGPHGVRDYWGFDAEAQLLASRGYHVLQVNFRGSGGYGVDYLKAGFGEWGGLMQDDLTDATRWAVQTGIAAAGQVCIFGASYGAYAALMGAAKAPDLYRCAIGYSGIYDLTAMERFGDVRRRRAGLHYLRRILGDDPQQRRQRSPVYQAERIEAAVMLVHGGLDQRAPLEHAQRLRDALQKAGKTVDWFVDGNQGHGFFGEDARTDLYRRILGFLDSHIGQRASPSA